MSSVRLPEFVLWNWYKFKNLREKCLIDDIYCENLIYCVKFQNSTKQYVVGNLQTGWLGSPICESESLKKLSMTFKANGKVKMKQAIAFCLQLFIRLSENCYLCVK